MLQHRVVATSRKATTMIAIGAVAACLLFATAAVARYDDAGDEMRPAHTAKLTPDTFDEWVQTAVDNKKTAVVRWMMSDDSTNDCSWLKKGYMVGMMGEHHDPAMGGEHDLPDMNQMAAEEGEDEHSQAVEELPPEPEQEEDHLTALAKELKTAPCAVVRALR